MGKVEVSVIVPVFNNAGTLDELIDRIVAVLEPLGRPFELIFVDDGSSDTSWALLQRRAERDARIRPFALTRNFGSQAAACAAFNQVRGRHVVAIDADLENFPEDIPSLLAPLDEGYDFVAGYRQDRHDPWLTRRLPSRVMNWYVRRRAGRGLKDVGCGMRAFEASLVEGLDEEGEARRLLSPLLMRRASRIAEVPIRYAASSTPGGHSFISLLAVATDYYLYTARRPFLAAGMASAFVALAGVALLVCGQVLPGLIATVAGLLGGLCSLVGEYVQRIYQLARNDPFYELRRPGPRPTEPVPPPVEASGKNDCP